MRLGFRKRTGVAAAIVVREAARVHELRGPVALIRRLARGRCEASIAGARSWPGRFAVKPPLARAPTCSYKLRRVFPFASTSWRILAMSLFEATPSPLGTYAMSFEVRSSSTLVPHDEDVPLQVGRVHSSRGARWRPKRTMRPSARASCCCGSSGGPTTAADALTSNEAQTP